MKALSVLALLALGACASAPQPQPQIRVVEVKVPVLVPCTTGLPDPVYSDTDEALQSAPDIFERVKLLLAGRSERGAQDAAERAARAACEG